MTPTIGIPVPTSRDVAYNQRSWNAYASSVTRSGGEAIAMALDISGSELHARMGRCDGFVLPGSPADVHPEKYGEGRHEGTAEADAPRERVDWLLLDHAARYAKPVLGICFGLQSINVWRGGSLVQDLSPVPVNHSAGAQIAVAHTVIVAPESLLGSLLDPAEAPWEGGFMRLPVNTSHHQAVSKPGDRLKIVARCPEDGVVEALELDDEDAVFHVEHRGRRHFVLGVQWHPERSYDISAASRALFARLVLEARECAFALAGMRANAGGE
jgi:putative glutamine amidotransferase